MADCGVTVSDFDSLTQSLERALRAYREFAERAQRVCLQLHPADFRQPEILAKMQEFIAMANECKRQDAYAKLAMARCVQVIGLLQKASTASTVN
jgi:hypothetical protein